MLPILDLLSVDLFVVNRVSSFYRIGCLFYVCSLVGLDKFNMDFSVFHIVKFYVSSFVYLWNISYHCFSWKFDNFDVLTCVSSSYYSLSCLNINVSVYTSLDINYCTRNWFSNFSGLSFFWNDTLMFSLDHKNVSLQLLYGLIEDFYILELNSCVFLSKILLIYYCSYMNSLLLAWYDSVVLGNSIIDFTMLNDGKDCKLLLTCF